MADYFKYFSLIVPLPDEPAQKYALELADQVSFIQDGEETPADFPPSLAKVIDDWRFEAVPEASTGGWGIWHHSTNGGLDAVCAFIQHLLRKFNLAAHVIFEWSYDCSKPRVDAYGGGAAIITARRIKTMSTTEWLQKQTAARARKNRLKGGTT